MVARDDFVHIQRGEADFRILPLSVGNAREGVYLAEQTYASGAKISAQWMIHNGFIGGMVVQGTIELHLDGVVFTLNAGDGFNFSLNRDHTFVNRADAPCKLVCVSFGETESK